MVLHSCCLHLDLDRKRYRRHGRGQVCHSSLPKPPQGAVGVLGFSVLDCPTSSVRKASYWPGLLLGHHEWHWSSSSHGRHPSKATPVTPALVTAQRTSLLQSYPPALVSADSLHSDEFIYTGPWSDDKSIWQPVWHLLRLPILYCPLQHSEALVRQLSSSFVKWVSSGFIDQCVTAFVFMDLYNPVQLCPPEVTLCKVWISFSFQDYSWCNTRVAVKNKIK